VGLDGEVRERISGIERKIFKRIGVSSTRLR